MSVQDGAIKWQGQGIASYSGTFTFFQADWLGVGSAIFFGSETYRWGTGGHAGATCEVITNEDPLDWVNRLPSPKPTPEIDFTWTPRQPPLTYVFGGVIFETEYAQTRTGVPITFTASVRYPDYKRWWPVSFLWNFGDGTMGWGEIVEHTYRIANPFAEATLCVKDNYGDVLCITRRLLLVQLTDIRVSPTIVVDLI